ncbi:hypothetical protein AA18889_0470 [Acetobacter senegalensis DSM 18889]|nr:hypothetical protein AA18889_0470 [Acetobacter senegalensis DSM 18889]
MQFAIERGTRREEALGLRWRDIDFDRHALSLGKTKTMHRAVERGPEIRPLTPGAARLLRSLQAQRKSSRPGDLDDPRKISVRLYKNRSIIERFFARLKQFRGIATRYDKLKSTFFAAAQLVSTIIGIN